MLVSALLLQIPDQVTVEFDDFYKMTQEVYAYIFSLGNVNLTAMRLSPSRISVLDTVRKLGFVVTERTEIEGKKKIKLYSISMKNKKDHKILLSLIYYSNNLLQNLVIDFFIGKLLQRQAQSSESCQTGEVLGQVEKLMDMFRFENLKRHPRGLQSAVQRRIASLVQQKELKNGSADGIIIEQVSQLRGEKTGSSEFRLIGFLADLGSYMLDSYLIVLCALESMLQGK